jgi:WD40 repeat protein
MRLLCVTVPTSFPAIARRCGVITACLLLLPVALLTAVAVPGRGGAAEPADADADTAWNELLAQMKAPGARADRLRHQVLAFRERYWQSPHVADAAGLLRELPSPLDDLDPRKIPPLERYDWQPRGLVAVLGEHRGRHGGFVYGVAFHPAGRFVASAGSPGTIRTWDVATMRLRSTLAAHGAAVSALAFSRNGRVLATSGHDATIRIWDVKGTEVKSRFVIKGPSTPLITVALSPNGKTVAAGGSDTQVYVWDVGGREPRNKTASAGHTRTVSALAFTPDGKTLLSAGHDGAVRFWDVTGDSARVVHVLPAHEKEIHSLALSSDGRTLATGSADQTMRLWRVQGNRARRRAEIATTGALPYALAFSPNGRTLAGGMSDASVRLWEVSAAATRPPVVLTGNRDAVLSVAFSPGGHVLATGGTDWTVRLWDLDGKPRERRPPRGHLSHVYAAVATPDGRTLATCSNDRRLRFWDLQGGEYHTRAPLKGDDAVLTSLAMTPDGKVLAAGGVHTAVRLWEVARDRELRLLKDHPGAVAGVAVSPDGRLIATCSSKSAFLWDLATGRRLHELRGHTTDVLGVCFTPDARQLVSVGGVFFYPEGGKPVVPRDCAPRVWDVASGKQTRKFAHDYAPTWAAAAAVGGNRLVTGGQESLARVWDLKGTDDQEPEQLKGTGGYVLSLAVSPDGKTAVTTGLDSPIIWWDLATGKRLREWTLPESLGKVQFAPDGRHLIVPLGTGPVYILRLAPPARRWRT